MVQKRFLAPLFYSLLRPVTLLFIVAVLFPAAIHATEIEEVIGSVRAIDAAEQEFTILTQEDDTFVFSSSPATEYAWKDKILDLGSFDDLKTGMWVKVDYLPGKKVHTATRVNLYKKKQ